MSRGEFRFNGEADGNGKKAIFTKGLGSYRFLIEDGRRLGLASGFVSRDEDSTEFTLKLLTAAKECLHRGAWGILQHSRNFATTGVPEKPEGLP